MVRVHNSPVDSPQQTPYLAVTWYLSTVIGHSMVWDIIQLAKRFLGKNNSSNVVQQIINTVPPNKVTTSKVRVAARPSWSRNT
jgi:hypothetical protein